MKKIILLLFLLLSVEAYCNTAYKATHVMHKLPDEEWTDLDAIPSILITVDNDEHKIVINSQVKQDIVYREFITTTFDDRVEVSSQAIDQDNDFVIITFIFYKKGNYYLKLWYKGLAVLYKVERLL